MIGVHGNALTSLLWMKPSKRSTVMEFFFPEGFTYDYNWPTRSLGMVHYGFWGDKYVESVLFLFGSIFWLFGIVSDFVYLFMGCLGLF